LFSGHDSAWARASRRVGWAASLVLVLLLGQSALWTGHIPWPLKILVVAVAVLAAIRPGHALVILAGLAPLGHVMVTSIPGAYPFGLSEALVLAFFAGYLWWRRPAISRMRPDSFALPTRLFALVVLASCAVQFVVVQIWHDYPLQYASDFIRFLATGYLTTLLDPRAWVDGRGFVATAALLLEGVALFRCTKALCAEYPPLARRLTTAIVAAGTGAALLSFYAVVATAVSQNQSLGVVASARWPSPALPSLDTAGVYFMFVVFAAAGVAAASRPSLVPGLLAAGVCFGAMWLTRTRVAIVAGLAIVVAGAFWRASATFRWSLIRTALVSALAALAVGVGVVIYNPFHILAAGGDFALHLRVLMSQTALRMIAAAPLLGVGIGQYEARYRDFASPELLKYYSTINAHNYFLWMGAELGLLGLGLFTWLVATAFGNAWSQLRNGRSRYELVGIFAGLSAFVITWVIGQPMAVPQMAYTFWIALGLAAASTGGGGATTTVAVPHRSLLARIAVIAIIVGAVASVPTRARRAVDDIDLSRVSYGFYNPGETENHRPFTWAGPSVTFYMRSSVRAIDLPLAALLPSTRNGVEVDILVNERAASHIVLGDREWHMVRVNTPLAPGSSSRFWRVDLRLTPIGIPADTPDEERRIAVGEILKDRR
jgi:O-antigen ligase